MFMNRCYSLWKSFPCVTRYLYCGGCRPPRCTHIFTSVTEPGIIAFCVGDFPEDSHIVAETCRRHIVKWRMIVCCSLCNCWIKFYIVTVFDYRYVGYVVEYKCRQTRRTVTKLLSRVKLSGSVVQVGVAVWLLTFCSGMLGSNISVSWFSCGSS
jgi:hypothetical protein